jgi:dolichol-phosphate mannosyltransferase
MPVYNEGRTIETTISEIKEEMTKEDPSISILVFEDGSKDDTKEVLKGIAETNKDIRIQTSPERKGYPKAVKDALESVNEDEFDWVLFMDSDGQYDPNDIRKLWTVAEKDPSVDIVMGRRKNRAEPFYRDILSSGLKVLERLLFSPPCKDVTSAFRLMKVGVAKALASKIRYSQHNFWLEFTARATEEGYTVEEVPVEYRAREGGSNVYCLRKMPRIVSGELSALVHTWWEYKWKEASKFAAVGLSGALVILGLTYLLATPFSQNVLLSAGLAIEVSIIWAFVLNDRITFSNLHHSKPLLSRLAQYNFLSLGGFLINETVLFGLISSFHTYYLAAEFCGILVAFAFNYFTNTKWTWVKVRNPSSVLPQPSNPQPMIRAEAVNHSSNLPLPAEAHRPPGE